MTAPVRPHADLVIAGPSLGMHPGEARKVADQALEILGTRNRQLAAAGERDWAGGRLVVRVMPSREVLRDPVAVDKVCALVRFGRKAAIVVQLIDYSQPATLADFGEAVLRDMVAMYLEHEPADRLVTYEQLPLHEMKELQHHCVGD